MMITRKVNEKYEMHTKNKQNSYLSRSVRPEDHGDTYDRPIPSLFWQRAGAHYPRGALYSAGQDRLDLRTGQVYFGRSVAASGGSGTIYVGGKRARASGSLHDERKRAGGRLRQCDGVCRTLARGIDGNFRTTHR